MDIFIKRKHYDKVYEFLNESSQDSDWQILIDNIKISSDLFNHFKDFLIGLRCVFTVKLYFMKLLSLNTKDKIYQEILYDLINDFINGDSDFSSHVLIKNLLFIQTLKICVLDEKNNPKLNDLISNNRIEDKWFIDLLENFHFFKELGYLYEIKKDYKNSITYYEMSGCNEKVCELSSIII